MINAISVKNVTKKFKVYLDKKYSLKEKILTSYKEKYEEKTVLKGVSFDVKRGESIGIIGNNGCGKSTLLKIINKIMYPTTGTVETHGKIASLIELGAGFHPDMSGLENIYINASIFGLSKNEIERKIGDIIRFSDLEDNIYEPIRVYSSGMYMRLAFSIAVNVNADILLIDEILAVGDMSFQQKCLNRINEIKNTGVTIVLVSHSLEQIEKFCDRAIWIEDGKIKEAGDPKEVGMAYTKSTLEGK